MLTPERLSTESLVGRALRGESITFTPDDPMPQPNRNSTNKTSQNKEGFVDAAFHPAFKSPAILGRGLTTHIARKRISRFTLRNLKLI